MNKEEKKTKIAVYGSLRKGLGNHRLISDCKQVGTFETEPKFTLYSLGAFPGLKKEGTTSVKMEVYEVDKTKLARVDMLEGFSGENNSRNLYNRFTIETPYGEAFCYDFNHNVDGYLEVESGDWTEYKTKKQ